MRREDYQPRTTPEESPFRKFDVACLKCGSYFLRLTAQFDEESGETCLVLLRTKCSQREILPLK